MLPVPEMTHFGHISIPYFIDFKFEREQKAGKGEQDVQDELFISINFFFLINSGFFFHRIVFFFVWIR